MDNEEDFWSHVVKSDGCWPWIGTINYAGYGRVLGAGGLDKQAHRVAYELLVGPVPDGLELDHLCRNRLCVNPSHLEPVTHQENILRGVSIVARNAKVTHCPQGHPYSGSNLYVSPQGRRCRTCSRTHKARYRVKLLPRVSRGAADRLDEVMG